MPGQAITSGATQDMERDLDNIVINLEKTKARLEEIDNTPEEQAKLDQEAQELTIKIAELEKEIKIAEEEIKNLQNPASPDFGSEANDQKLQDAQEKLHGLTKDKMQTYLQKVDGEGRLSEKDGITTIHCYNDKQFKEGMKEISSYYDRLGIEYDIVESTEMKNGREIEVYSFVTRELGQDQDRPGLANDNQKEEEKEQHKNAPKDSGLEDEEERKKKEAEEKKKKGKPTHGMAEKAPPTEAEIKADEEERKHPTSKEPVKWISDDAKKSQSKSKQETPVSTYKPATKAPMTPATKAPQTAGATPADGWAAYSKKPDSERKTHSAMPPHGLHPLHHGKKQ